MENKKKFIKLIGEIVCIEWEYGRGHRADVEDEHTQPNRPGNPEWMGNRMNSMNETS